MARYLWLVLWAGCAVAQEKPDAVADLRAPVRAGSPHTYATLLSLACTDFEVDDDQPQAAFATSCAPMRLVNSADKPEPGEEDVTIEDVRLVRARIAAPGQVLLMFTVAGGDEHPYPRRLALFDTGAAPRLLDAVELPSTPDDSGTLSADAPLRLAASEEAFLFETNHHNSSQHYRTVDVIFAGDGRIHSVAGVMLLSCALCGPESFRESVKFSTVPDTAAGRNRVMVRATLEQYSDDSVTDAAQRKKKSSRTFTAVFGWDGTRGEYRDTSGSLKELEAFNQKNF